MSKSRVQSHQHGIDQSLMAARNLKVVPVGAWVEGGPQQSAAPIYDPMLAAVYEEERLQRLTREKEAKLKQFQREVRRRVQELRVQKMEQQLQENSQEADSERNMVYQTVLAAERVTPKKDRRPFRHNHNLAPPSPHGIAPGINRNAARAGESHEDQFENHCHQVRRSTRQARRNLAGRQVVQKENFGDDYDVPAGMWGASSTRDHQSQVSQDVPEVIELDDEQDTYRHPRIHPEGGHGFEAHHMKQPFSSVPDFRPGLAAIQTQQQKQSRYWMSRRLFMDIERHQVKERAQQEHHRRRINRIKQKTESARREEEAILAVTLAQEQTSSDTTQRLSPDRSTSSLEDSRREQRHKELDRYVEALRARLCEKVEQQNIRVPPLCSCGPTVWDTNPNTCANNCMFYRNPKAYAKALQSLLASCDVL
ncbi:CCDC15 [Branchiostoma lanceolatum]|uniref:CCDC15 protein n=1 Tax=Branchiostoma lanceolatum TaxID=7740 RepID=A0A8J9ZXC8_BRALA|nr:CCDC15 [Branchiostoma lanceolatum]